MKALEISGWMSQVDLEWLAEQAKTKDIIVEVGSYQGRSTRALGENVRICVFAVDDWQGLRTVDKNWWEGETPEDERIALYERFVANVHDLMDAGKVVPIHANHAKVPELPIADMVFIDGSHDYDSVKRDIQTWLRRLRSGGLLCGHDGKQNNLLRAVNECLGPIKMEADLIWHWVKP